jgi:hypothetical protein
MGQPTGQTSKHQPAVVYDGQFQTYHMVFSADDSSNRIIYATSSDGLNNWTLGQQQPGQSTGSAPALALHQFPAFGGGFSTNLLVLVFVANDSSNRVLYSTLNLQDQHNDPNNTGWSFQGQLGDESAHGVFALGFTQQPTNPSVTVYFTSNDPSNSLLEHNFIPS